MSVDCRGGAARRNRPPPVAGLWTKGIPPVTLAAGGKGGPHPVQARAVAVARRLPERGRRPALGIERHPVSLHLAPQRQEAAPCGCERLWPPRRYSRPT